MTAALVLSLAVSQQPQRLAGVGICHICWGAHEANHVGVTQDLSACVLVCASHADAASFMPTARCAGRRSHPRTGKGRPPPGEKAKKKRARVEAKRAARGEHCGTDLAAIEAELRSFVLSRGDLKVRPVAP